MMQIKFKKGRIPFEKLQELLESGLDGEEFELPEVICSNSSYYLYKLHHYGISDTWSLDLISKNTGRTLKYHLHPHEFLISDGDAIRVSPEYRTYTWLSFWSKWHGSEHHPAGLWLDGIWYPFFSITRINGKREVVVGVKQAGKSKAFLLSEELESEVTYNLGKWIVTNYKWIDHTDWN